MITAERLRALLAYDPNLGIFVWRVQKGRAYAGEKAGRMRKDGYVTIKLDQRDYLAHRLAWLLSEGKWPAEVDHINGNPSDNRLENLRECTRSENFANRRARPGRPLPKGVRSHKGNGRYYARIVVKRRELSLGSYSTADEAHSAYMAAAKKYYGEFARAR